MTLPGYSGRLIDVLAYQGFTPGQTNTIDVRELGSSSNPALVTEALAIPGSPGSVVTGILKLVQRYMVTLLTERGSLQYLPTVGSDFLLDAKLGRWRTVADVRQSFSSANLDVGRQLLQAQLSSDPADEVFAGAVLKSVVMTADSVSIILTIKSAAGSAVTFIAPVSVTP
jgi:hypothetical protein